MNAMGQQVYGNLMQTLQQYKASGLTPQQAYEKIMQNPQFAQKVQAVQKQYPNMSIQDIARQKGIDLTHFNRL